MMEPYALVPQELTRDSELSVTARIVWMELAVDRSRQDYTDRTVIKSLHDIAVDIGISERAARRAVAELKEAGWISVKRTGRESAYTLHVEKRG